jgi:hypothetical protein
MEMLVIIGSSSGAAMDGIRAREADGLHNVLHGVAPAVASSVDATHMTLAGGLELVTACRTDDMTHVALHAEEYVIGMFVQINCT